MLTYSYSKYLVQVSKLYKRFLRLKLSTASTAMSSASETNSEKHKFVIAVCQITSTWDKQQNYNVCESLVEEAKERGASMAFLPECFDYIMSTTESSVSAAEELCGPVMSQYKSLARRSGVWLSLGGFHHRPSSHQISCDDQNKIENLHIIIDNNGEIKATYAKTHLFDVDIEGKVKLKESDFTIPGSKIVPPVDTPIGKIGLQTCYDMRFPELSILLRQQGADILTYPSAFTQPTGQAHWESLLRCRALENQCYVVAAAQVGRHNEKRASHGHSMIIDPWGKVLVDCGEDVGVRTAEIDLDYLQRVRSNMPVMRHKRNDLYASFMNVVDASAVDLQSQYTFGHVNVPSSQVFCRSTLSYACVNIKPVLSGHVLVVPLRSVERLTDLSSPEVNDLFLTVQKVSDVVQKHYHANSVTVAVQDGPDSGQTIKHVHVHVIPRRPNDIPFNDDVYNKLQTHDADMTDTRTLRTEDEMEDEAMTLRRYFCS